ncbi:MAG: AAA family ATPase [Verrucomicrobia bacterium]|nr:AAA family ATPase [Verrucomicrobiota bacterium]
MKPTTLGPVTAGIPKKLRRVSEPAISKVAVRRKPAPSQDFSFTLKPADIARHLNRFVIGQNEAKKVLGVALCDHFQHVRLTLEGQEAPFYQKQNVLLLGPTGVGKTHLIRSAADLIGVPFVKADATKFSETGYVGGDVDDLVRDLIRRAGGDIKRASHGIIYLDEVDKLAGSSEGGGRDVSGRGVQTNLLKIMEDGDVPVLSPNDVTGQLQSAMSAARGNTPGMPDTISTRHILFIASGAFVGLDGVIRSRLGQNSMSPAKALAQAGTSDFIRFGLEPEFIGRLPVRVACHALDEDDLFQVLEKSESSLIHQYKRSFAAYDIKLRFEPCALRKLAALARTEETGARGLMTVLERTFRDLKFRLPSTRLRALTITAQTVENPAAALAKLLKK